MKAVAFDRHGGLDVLEYRDLPDPSPAADEVVVRLEAAALNHLDLFVREGWAGLRLALPHIPGADGAGVVEAVGSRVTEVEQGQRVVLNPGLSCGRCLACLRGEDSLCVEYRILGEHANGTYAELVAVPARNVLPVPAGFPLEKAAAAPLTFMTAWRLLITRARVRPGEEVLVLGAGGGVASAAIQIAKLAGARVTATTSTEEKAQKARELGADAVVNYREEPWSKVVWERTGKRGVDVVLDSVGEATWPQSLRTLAPNGRLVTPGATSGPKVETDVRYVFWRQLQVLGSTMGTRAELDRVLRLVWAGRLEPVIDTIFPLAEAQSAQERLAGGEQFGKILLRP